MILVTLIADVYLFQGNSHDASHHRTQAEAIEADRGIAENSKSELVIHGRDGCIRDENSYGNDPYPPKG